MKLPHVATAVLILSGCGDVGEPLYPLLNIPKPVADLSAIDVPT